MAPKPKERGIKPARFYLGQPNVDPIAEAAQARALASQAKHLARGRDVLFHGTRYRALVLSSGFLQYSSASMAVAMTRSVQVAAYFATMPREDDEGSGAILVFDRHSLKTRYRLDCIADGWQADPSEFNEFWRAKYNEFEERIYGRNVEIWPHLVGLVSTPSATLTRKRRAAKRTVELRVAEETMECLCGARWGLCADCVADRLKKKASQLEEAYPGISNWWRPVSAAKGHQNATLEVALSMTSPHRPVAGLIPTLLAIASARRALSACLVSMGIFLRNS